MNKKDYTSAKINLVRKYYSKALGIFAGTVNKNRNKEPKPFPGYAYVVDLFSGSGLYEDGTLGTPLSILEAYNTLISVSPHLKNTIIFIFNDYEERNIKSLKSRIASDQIWRKYLKQIKFLNVNYLDAVDEVDRIIEENLKCGTTSFLIDPYGYKPINLQFLQRIMKDSYNEAILLWTVQFIIKYLSAKNKTHQEEYLEKLISKSNVLTIKKLITNEEKYTKAIECFQSIIQEQNIARFVPDFTMVRDDGRSWYTIFCLSNHTRSKEVFDQARSIIGNLTTRYRSTTTKITTNLNFYFSDDPNTPQTNIDI